MALATGARLGPYQIVAPIGAGGMGEVYKATDTRLDRTVAIKVLPAHVASDSDLKQTSRRNRRSGQVTLKRCSGDRIWNPSAFSTTSPLTAGGS